MIALFTFSLDFQTVFQAAAVFSVAHPMRLIHRLLHLSSVVQVNVLVLDNESDPFDVFINTLHTLTRSNPITNRDIPEFRKIWQHPLSMKGVFIANRAKILQITPKSSIIVWIVMSENAYFCFAKVEKDGRNKRPPSVLLILFIQIQLHRNDGAIPFVQNEFLDFLRLQDVDQRLDGRVVSILFLRDHHVGVW